MKILVINELKNVNVRFRRAIWRKYTVNAVYKSAKEAKKYHNLKNCEYQYLNAAGEVIARYNNTRVDTYGTRV